MNEIGKGIVSGFVATTALSMVMVAKSAMGLMPQLDVVAMLGDMMGAGPALGWIAHFMIGSLLWGGLFALLVPRLPGYSTWLKGVVFSIAAWLMMMIAVMPMAGAGVFGLGLGIAAPIMTLMLHVLFGAVLGGVYAGLQGSSTRHRHAHS